METWFNEDGLGNILSFDKVEELYPITYEHKKKTFVVHTKGIDDPQGKVRFERSEEGFPYGSLRGPTQVRGGHRPYQH